MNKFKISKIALFLDGRPGHEKQTLGIVENLKKKTDFEIISYTVQKPPLASQCVNWLSYLIFSNSWSCHDLSGCDLVIGTGTHTHLPMLLAKKHYNLPVITCMTPNPLVLKNFDLIFAPYHDNVVTRDNIMRTVGPPNTNVDIKKHKESRVLILLGGMDPRSHIWDNDSIIASIEALLTHEPEKRYVISSSPRTPRKTEEAIDNISCKFKNVEFYKFEDTQAGWVEEEYSNCKYVWVTGDSISMVYEALSSGCRVGIIPVTWKSQKSKFLRSEIYLRKHQLTVNLGSYLMGKVDWSNNKALNEAERCANEILRRWG